MIDLQGFSEGKLQEAAQAARIGECPADPQRRALAAYFRGGNIEPPINGALPVVYEDKLYLAVVGAEQVLAVYRVRHDLQLKRLRRIPLPVAARAELSRKTPIGRKENNGG